MTPGRENESELPAEGGSIDRALALLGRSSGASRAYIFRARHIEGEGTRYDNTHEWCDAGTAPQRDQLQDVPAEAMPWWCARMERGLGIDADPVSALPPEAELERELLEAQDIHRLIVRPFREPGGRNGGFLGIDGVGASHPGWPAGTQASLEGAVLFVEAAFAAQDASVRSRRQLVEVGRRVGGLEIAGALLNGVAHDLANVLGVVGLNAEVIKDGVGEPADDAQALEDVLASSARGQGLLRRVLGLVRGAEAEVQILRFDECVEGMASLLRRAFYPGIRVEFVGGGRAARVRFAAPHLDQVLLNLAVNARDVSPPNGRIIIRTSMEDRTRVCVEVHDDGPGVAPELAERIFEAFFTTKQTAGTGLGLHTVRALAEAQGGQTGVCRSDLLRGACFRVTLPLVGTEAGDGPVPVASGRLPDLRGRRVVLLEDERALRVVLRRTLSGAGAQVEEFGTVAGALRRLESGPVDVVLLDLQLPDGSGFDVAAIARVRHPNARIVAMSAQGGPEMEAALAGLGLPLLEKPFRRESLAAALGGPGPMP